jgi:hypothetical protein
MIGMVQREISSPDSVLLAKKPFPESKKDFLLL